MRTMKVNTATRESDEQFKTDKYLRCAVTNGKARLDFIPDLFFTPLADNMAASWLRQHSEYDGGSWSYWVIPQGVGGNIAPNSIQFITTCGMKIKFHHFMLNEPIDLIGWSACYL